jgi:methylenetetrahydrofolate--tRNA-(uracil-5-)-methyltransferase
MNINFGLLPEPHAPMSDATGKRLKGKEKGRAKKRAVALRALSELERWLASARAGAAAAE